MTRILLGALWLALGVFQGAISLHDRKHGWVIGDYRHVDVAEQLAGGSLDLGDPEVVLETGKTSHRSILPLQLRTHPQAEGQIGESPGSLTLDVGMMPAKGERCSITSLVGIFLSSSECSPSWLSSWSPSSLSSFGS